MFMNKDQGDADQEGDAELTDWEHLPPSCQARCNKSQRRIVVIGRQESLSKWRMTDSLSSTNLDLCILSKQDGMEERLSLGSYKQPKRGTLFESSIPSEDDKP